MVSNDFALDTVISDVQELNGLLFAFQDIKCQHLRAGLMELQHGNSGRVLLADYYGTGLKDEFLFVEHLDYLKKKVLLMTSTPLTPASSFLTS